jgi:hypothetical protein
MEAETIFTRINADGAEIEFVGRAENPNGNFAAVRSQQSLNGPQLTRRATRFRILAHEREYCSWEVPEPRLPPQHANVSVCNKSIGEVRSS